ncbi:MAG: CBS domain-containing protein [Magnetococcales bacterium]|nr:CBS domain-containing protein [Magnetococcales bacterium]MBF0263092.1 CBS domain-containing protein [Magnetococcales bacterium]
MKAKDIMVSDVITAPPEMSVRDLARLLTENRIGGVPIVEEGRLLGMVTEEELLSQVKTIHPPLMLTILDAVIPIAGEFRYEEDLRRMAASTAGEIMNIDLDVVDEETDLAEIATLISDRHVALVPVLRGETLVGIIGKRDVIRGMLADDAA